MEDKLRLERELGRVQPAPLFSGRTEAQPAFPAGAEWGLVSVSLGSVLALMAPTTLILIAVLEMSGYRGFSTLDKRLAAVGGYLAALMILLLVIVNVSCGIRSLIAAREQKRPIALGLAGVLLNGLNLYMWLGAALAWHASIWPRL